MNIKAILLDIDGTLTNHKKEITPLTKKALMDAQDLGIRLVIASGRPAKGIYQYGDQLEMAKHHGLFVCYNGAKVIDCETKETYVDVTFPVETAKRVLHHMKNFNVIPIVTSDTHMLVEDVYHCMIKDGTREFNVIQYESRMNNYKLMEVDDLEEYVNYPQNKILTAGDSDYLQAHYKEMAEPFQDELNMMFTSNFYYEFTAKGVDKGSALTVAMSKLGIQPEECIAFGDAENDISMLKFAGISVAMANGQEAVKNIATEVTDDNEHDGIAKALYKYIPSIVR